MAVSPTYEKPAARVLSEKMQRRVLSVVLKSAGKFAQCRSFLDPKLFSDDILSDVLAYAVNVWDEHHEIPSADALADAFTGRDDHVRQIRRVFKLNVLDQKYTIERIATFARNRSMEKAILQCAAIIKYRSTKDVQHLESAGLLDSRTGKIKKGFENELDILQRANAVGTDAGDTGTFFHDSMKHVADRVLNPKKKEYLYTGYGPLDQYARLALGDVGCVIGRGKSGKSHFLLGIAYHAILSGHDVLYVNCEIDQEALEDRVARRVAGTKADYWKDPQDFVERMQRRHAKLCIGKLKMRRFQQGMATISDVRGLLMQCNAEGFYPRVLIVDYVGILRPEVVMQEERHNLARLWVAFRGLCQEFRLFGWSAAQTNREGAKNVNMMKDSPVLNAENLAEAYAILAHIDLGISLTRSKEELERNAGRIHIFANRNGRDGMTFNFSEDYSRSILNVESGTVSGTTGSEKEARKKAGRKHTTDEQRAEAQMRVADAKRKERKAKSEDVHGPGA